jgi:hypothetical protein
MSLRNTENKVAGNRGSVLLANDQLEELREKFVKVTFKTILSRKKMTR